jgi:prevent-host-death family protein
MVGSSLNKFTIDPNLAYTKLSLQTKSSAMDTVNIHQAKTHLSQLLSRVELGEEIVIANRGVPVAKLVPIDHKLDRRSSMGIDRGLFQVPTDFNACLPADLLAAFDGGEV